MLARSLLVLVLVTALNGCSQTPSATAADQAAPTPSAAPIAPPAPVTALARIEDPSLVCMVNDAFMGRPQIPVEVGGKTYFGCCEMCKGRLANEPTTRTATDPVTGAPVDKASAVLAQDPSGRVLYFASEDTLRRYHP